MAKDRLAPCTYYINNGNCTKGRKADHSTICQTCSKYLARKGYRIQKNKKKESKLKGTY